MVEAVSPRADLGAYCFFVIIGLPHLGHFGLAG